MKYEIIIRPEAEDDIREAYHWYEEQNIGLGAEFIRCLEAVLDYLENNPEMYQKIHKSIRRALTSRFPFGIFYIKEKKRVIILAVLHVKREPKVIIERT